MMKQTITYTMLLTGLLAGLFYVGGTILAIGLAAIGLTTVIFISFAIGSKWTAAMYREGAEIAIRSAGQNDAHDAVKIKAMAALAQEVAKVKNQGQQPQPRTLPPSQQYPVLPPASFIDGSFTISGLDNETELYSGGENDQED